VDVRGSAEVSVDASRGGVTASTVAGFTSVEAGAYTVSVPPSPVDGAQVLLVEDTEVGGFLAGLFGTIAGVFLVCVLAVVGLGMTIGGGVWWGYRARARHALTRPGTATWEDAPPTA
jgi:hypothetical protein